MNKISQRNPRSGSILVIVIVLMIVASTILFGMVQGGIRHRRQLRQELQMEQTRLMLDAGIRTAIKKVKSQPAYSGETISIDKFLGEHSKATIEIKVDESGTSEELNPRPEVLVLATLSGAGEWSFTTQRSHTMFVARTEQNSSKDSSLTESSSKEKSGSENKVKQKQ
jgi:type II secretory pathway pseudopilin PulG